MTQPQQNQTNVKEPLKLEVLKCYFTASGHVAFVFSNHGFSYYGIINRNDSYVSCSWFKDGKTVPGVNTYEGCDLVEEYKGALSTDLAKAIGVMTESATSINDLILLTEKKKEVLTWEWGIPTKPGIWLYGGQNHCNSYKRPTCHYVKPDLEYTAFVKGWWVFICDLPKIEFPYTTVCEGDVGKEIEVRDNDYSSWNPATLIALLGPEIENKYICNLVGSTPGVVSGWRQARKKFSVSVE